MFGGFNFNVNTNKVIQENITSVVNKYVSENKQKDTVTASCGQVIEIGPLTNCPKGGSIKNLCDMTIKTYQELTLDDTRTLMNQITSNIQDTIKQSNNRKDNFWSALTNVFSAGAQINNTKIDNTVKNLLDNDDLRKNITSTSKTLAGNQKIVAAGIDCAGGGIPDFTNEFNLDLFSQQTQSLVMKTLTSNQAYTQMINNIDQSNTVSGAIGIIIIIIIIGIVMAGIAAAFKYYNKKGKGSKIKNLELANLKQALITK